MAMIGGGIFVLAIGCFLYGIAMTKCIKGSLFAVSQNAHAKPDRILKQLAEFTEFHSRVKQLSIIFINKKLSLQMSIHLLLIRLVRDFSDIYQGIITVLFLWSLVSMCGALLMIQIKLVQYSFDSN